MAIEEIKTGTPDPEKATETVTATGVPVSEAANTKQVTADSPMLDTGSAAASGEIPSTATSDQPLTGAAAALAVTKQQRGVSGADLDPDVMALRRDKNAPDPVDQAGEVVKIGTPEDVPGINRPHGLSADGKYRVTNMLISYPDKDGHPHHAYKGDRINVEDGESLDNLLAKGAIEEWKDE